MRLRANNLPLRQWISDLRAALGFLTRLPVRSDTDSPRPESVWAWPVAGACIGGAAGLAALMVTFFAESSAVAAIAALATLMVVAGCLHEDGLADTADGLWGGKDPESRLEIMRDSRVGTYGVAALILVSIARFAAIAETLDSVNPLLFLMSVGAVSRAVMLLTMHVLPPARQDGLAAGIGPLPVRPVWAGCAAALCIAVLLLGWQALPMTGVAALAAAALNLSVRRLVGGSTGDTLGATQQVGETACLLYLAAAL